jgi:hypothetical protein
VRSPTDCWAEKHMSSPGELTTTLSLLDVASSFGLTGRQAEAALLDAGVVTNRNSIPGDSNGAWYTSGIRLGTPALTTLGFSPDELDEVAEVIVTALRATTPATSTAKAKYEIDARVAQACRSRCGDLLDHHPPLSRDRAVKPTRHGAVRTLFPWWDPLTDRLQGLAGGPKYPAARTSGLPPKCRFVRLQLSRAKWSSFGARESGEWGFGRSQANHMTLICGLPSGRIVARWAKSGRSSRSA